jgi:hypothetical protein
MNDQVLVLVNKLNVTHEDNPTSNTVNDARQNML